MIKCHFKYTDKLILIQYLKTSDFIQTKLINRTKKRLIDLISDMIMSLCESEIIYMFKEFISANQFNKENAIMYMKAFDISFQEKQGKILN